MSRIRRVTCLEVKEPPEGTFSNCLVIDGVAYTAGLTARARSGQVEESGEFEQALVIFVRSRPC